MNASTSTGSTPEHFRVAIIGAGFSGIGMGIKLLEAGETDFAIFERQDALGGTWTANKYPGVECDIQTDLYSYSFAPKKDWTKTYAPGSEVRSYLEDTAESFGVVPYIRFNHHMENATWDAAQEHWVIDTSQGRVTANVLLSCMGYLSETNAATLPGADSFGGTLIHSADWAPETDVTGKRVAVIGTGASGVQIVPAIQPKADQVDVYQRTPPWIMSKHDKEWKGFHAWAMEKVPFYHGMIREYHRLTAEMVVWQMARPIRTYFMEKIAQGHLNKSVKDLELRAKLQPDYKVGCKRILFSDTYYPALQEANCALVTDGIETVTPTGIKTVAGEERPADMIVLATGYMSAKLPLQNRITGENGQLLADAWADGQYAYLGSTVPGYPNFFMLLGPNTTVGHTSVTLMMEAQFAYVMDALKQMKARGLTKVDVKEGVVDDFNTKIQDALEPTVFNSGGCASYYRSGTGRNTTVWPHTTINFTSRTKRFDIENYQTA